MTRRIGVIAPYQTCSPLDSATRSALKTSIAKFGVLVPVAVDQDGVTIDGHHRRDLADELGVDCPVIVHEVEDREHALEIAATLNSIRRHMSVEERQAMVAYLRQEGHSQRAIAGAIGVGVATVNRDLGAGVPHGTPDRIVGADGRSYPASRPKPRPQPGDTITDDEGHQHDIIDTIDLPDENSTLLVDSNGDCTVIPNDDEWDDEGDEDEGPPQRRPQSDKHPATFPAGIIDLIAELIDTHHNNHNSILVLDPFAGVGGIHELRDLDWRIKTVGIEVEPEWANQHEHTLVGDALNLPMGNEEFDIVATSPTYGNRMADRHDAQDQSDRATYRHRLGRDLTDGSSAGMQWGDDYRRLHQQAWAEAKRVLTSDGLLIVNIKDHIRGGERQTVSAWHASTILDLGFELVDCVPFVTRGLPAGDNHEKRVPAELVWVFRKGHER